MAGLIETQTHFNTAGEWIAAIENGEIEMSLHDTLKAAKVLGVTYAQLMEDDELERLDDTEQVIVMLEVAAQKLQAPTMTKIDFEGYNEALRSFLLDCSKRLQDTYA